MPPKGKDRTRPGPEESSRGMRAVEAVLARIDCRQSHHAGRVTMRRLNRTEYNNTIRDLVGVDFKPAADFPNDDVGYGFDNIGDVPLAFSASVREVPDRRRVDPRAAQSWILRTAPARSRRGSRKRPPRRVWARATGAAVPSTCTRAGRSRAECFQEAGDYKVRVVAYGQQVGDEPVRAVLQINGKDVKEFEVKGDTEHADDDRGEARLKSGPARFADRVPQPLHRAESGRR